jgi:hypothetical protein
LAVVAVVHKATQVVVEADSVVVALEVFLLALEFLAQLIPLAVAVEFLLAVMQVPMVDLV